MRSMTNLAGTLAAILVLVVGAIAYNQYKKPDTLKISQLLKENPVEQQKNDTLTNPDITPTVQVDPKTNNYQVNTDYSNNQTQQANQPAANDQAAPQIDPNRISKRGDAVFVNYIGKLKNGTVFDTNQGKQPFGFVLGAGMVIKGWDEGLVGVKAGQVKHLVIPPEKGYGAAGVKGQDGKYAIPPNATLIFDIQVLAVEDYKPEQKQ